MHEILRDTIDGFYVLSFSLRIKAMEFVVEARVVLDGCEKIVNCNEIRGSRVFCLCGIEHQCWQKSDLII